VEARKNVVRLIRAYRRAIDTAALPHSLVLAGPLGWRAEAVHREVAVPGPGRVVLTGRIDPGALDALYRSADAFCYPSLYEGFGLPVLEAMARGVPVVCSNASSLPEVAGDAAVLVDPMSVGEMADAIARVLGDDRERERLGAAGRARAEGFSWERTARKTLEVYRKLAA
jgi:glycosyltransferase involved in cell wall biosynthesis